MAASIEIHGQLDPVVIFQGQILDGRTRNEARKRLKKPLLCQELTDLGGKDPFEWVVNRNMASGTTRNLSDSQRAMIGAELCAQVYQPQAKRRRQEGKRLSDQVKGTANQKAAQAVNVKENRIRDARAILDTNCSDLKDAVWRGELNTSNAAKIAKIKDKRVRGRALDAAKKKDLTALREALGLEERKRDARGEPIDRDLLPTFQAANTQKPHLASLRRLSRWLKGTAKLPEGRLLAVNVPSETFDLLIEKIEQSQPWCVCPFCNKTTTVQCQFCAGSRWLTEGEHAEAMESARKLLVARKTQDSTSQSSPEDLQ
jgi:hypothetical protein